MESTQTQVQVQGTIKLGRNTAGHLAWLQAHGYEAKLDGDKIVVSGSAFVSEVDLTGEDGGMAALQGMVAKKQLATYSTKFRWPNGDVRTSILACQKLGKASALVVKEKKGGTVKVNAYDAL